MAPRRKNRPTVLPETVMQRAISRARPAAANLPAAKEQAPTETRAVLVSDPQDTAPQSPSRRDRAPLVHQPSEPEPETNPAEETPAPIAAWYESAIEAQPTPTTKRGKVAVKVSGNNFSVVSQDADVYIDCDRPAPPAVEQPTRTEYEYDAVSYPLFLWAVGFLSALFIVWIALLGADRPVYILPLPTSSEAPRG